MTLSIRSARWFMAALTFGLASACGGATPAPTAPTPDEEDATVASSEEKDPQAGHDLDVGMDFGDEGESDEDEASEEDHGPPPTRAYSPASRLKDNAPTESQDTKGSPGE